METNKLCIQVCLIFLSCCSHLSLFSQNFKVDEVCDHIFIVSDPDLGSQVVVQSAEGLVIFDSFWSSKTAGLFKEEIQKIFKNTPVSFIVNMVDRLDMIGGNGMYPESIIVGHENIPAKVRNEDVEKEELSDLTMNMFWFGKAGKYNGLTMAVIPELGLAVASKAFVYPEYHLAPYPFPYYGDLDVPRWITMLEEVLEGESRVDRFLLSDDTKVYPVEQMQRHLDYIRELWNKVKAMEAEGKTLQEIQGRLSLDTEFAFVKEMPAYMNTGDFWIRPQHEMHVRLFFLQGKNLASEIIRKGGITSLQASLKKIRMLGKQVHFDEISLDFLGSEFMNKGRVAEAIEVFKLNLEAFPESSNAFNSMGTAFMIAGDEQNAEACFRKSIELNPDNERARQMLQEL